MGFPDRIERSISVARPPAKVWEAITTAEGLGTWFEPRRPQKASEFVRGMSLDLNRKVDISQ
jgi:uncharacterized protein YndB with AHSA1/START domain